MSIYIYKESALPSGYQQVERIQSDGNQYINTGYNHNANTKVDMKFNFQSMSTQWNMIYGARNNYNEANAFDFFVQYTSYIGYNIGGSTNDSLASVGINTDYEISVYKTKFIINGTEYNLSNNLTSYSYPDFIFWQSKGGNGENSKIKMKLYYCKISENLELVRDFVPCYRESDGVIGMYDLVGGQFYTNAGSGAFTKGADV